MKKEIIYNILKPYAAILFLDNKIVALFILFITFINPYVAISGIVAVLFTIIFAELIEFKESYLSQGFYIYNSLLVGMGIGYLYKPSFVSIFLIAIASALTFLLSFMLNRIFLYYKIPILSLPFSIVTMFAYLASLKYSGLLTSLVNNATIFDIELPLYLSGFFKSLGTILFLPNNLAGILIFVLVLFVSRIMAITAISGYYFGVFLHSLFIGSIHQAFNDPFSFNYILVSVALCGIFLLPTLKNFIISLIGVGISVVLTDAIAILFNYYLIPVFTLPFNITVISFIFILSLIYYKEFNLNIKQTPEASLSYYLSTLFRFGKTPIKISLPFSGEWMVYQGFDSKWTHKGKYKYAYDFVKTKGGSTYKDSGDFLDDYYAFGESVLAPVSGYVVDLRNDLVDNYIGNVDRINNWGNYIIIKSDLGFFVEISHLMQYSIKVNIGDYVKEGEVIAKCGNSGYSPQPHIHIQVQDFGVIGGFTKEFCFDRYIKLDELILNDIPKENEEIQSVIVDRSIESRLTFILDDLFTYIVFEGFSKKDEVTFRVKMDKNGEFYFTDKEKNRLYFYLSHKEFYFYNYIGGESYLKHIFIISPRIPFISGKEISFTDYLPVYLVKNRLEKNLIELKSTINKDAYKLEAVYNFDGESISSDYGIASLCKDKKGFLSFSYGSTKLVLKDKYEEDNVVVF